MSKALRAGTQTGSLINHLMSGSRGAEPEVGMGVTVLGWTDRHPATIVEVVKNKGKLKAVVIQRDEYKVVKGSCYDGSAEYEFTPNPAAGRETYVLRKNGAWAMAGDPPSNSLLIGTREKYYDPHF